MRKQGVILVITALMALILCGAVSAVDSSTIGGEGNVSNVSVSEDIDPVLWVNVDYEYADDNINPDIKVTDSNNDSMVFDKTKYSDTLYKLNFTYTGVTNGSLFHVMVQAPGYISQTKQIAVNQAGTDPEFVGSADFDMNATANYKLGREVTSIANQQLNFSTADAVLAITTAGVPQLNGGTSEDCIEGILNGSNGYVSYGKGNLLMLRQTAVDPVDFAFIVKRGTSLLTICFRNGTSTQVYQGSISENMTASEWNSLIAATGGENGFSFASLANAWNAGISTDVLREAAFHGHVCEGTLGGYTITKALLKYYPPIQATTGGFGSPGDITSYKVLGEPGGSDDDAAMYFLDSTPGKGGYAGFDTTSTGATDNMVAFIRWIDTTYKVVTNTDGTKSYAVDVPGTGTLIIMQYNKEKNRQDFQTETGITLNNDLAEMKYNTWLIQKIKNNPGELVTIIKELSGLTEEQYYYLLGTATNITYPTAVNATNKGQTRFVMQEAHGLDMNYINSLNLTNATRSTATTTASTLTYDQIKQIGIDAANLAKQIFENAGIVLEKDDLDFVVLTSAGYVYLNGQTTEATWDGIYEVLGSRLSRSTLLPIHMGIWKPLWFTFVLRGVDGITMSSVYLRYNENGTWFVGTNNDSKQVNNIGPAALNNATNVTNLGKYVIPDGNFFNIQSIANAWRNDPAFDQLVTFLFHDHACPGVQPGFFISDYIFQNYPLSGDQSYFWMASSIYCKDDSLVYLLGVSPGMGTYMNQRLTNDETMSEYLPGGTEEGMIVVWDPTTKTGKVAIISFKWPTYDLSGLTTSEAQREAMISGFVSLYKGQTSPYISQPLSIVTSHETYITEAEFNAIKQGGTATSSSLDYVKSIPIRSLSDLVPVEGGSQTGNTDSGSDTSSSTSQGSSTGTSTGSSNGNTGSSKYSSGSVGVTGTAVNAATETTTTEAGAQPAGDAGKSYEVTKAGTEGTNDTPWGTYAIVGIVSVLALGAVGFFFKGSLFGR